MKQINSNFLYWEQWEQRFSSSHSFPSALPWQHRAQMHGSPHGPVHDHVWMAKTDLEKKKKKHFRLSTITNKLQISLTSSLTIMKCLKQHQERNNSTEKSNKWASNIHSIECIKHSTAHSTVQEMHVQPVTNRGPIDTFTLWCWSTEEL